MKPSSMTPDTPQTSAKLLSTPSTESMTSSTQVLSGVALLSLGGVIATTSMSTQHMHERQSSPHGPGRHRDVNEVGLDIVDVDEDVDGDNCGYREVNKAKQPPSGSNRSPEFFDWEYFWSRV